MSRRCRYCDAQLPGRGTRPRIQCGADECLRAYTLEAGRRRTAGLSPLSRELGLSRPQAGAVTEKRFCPICSDEMPRRRRAACPKNACQRAVARNRAKKARDEFQARTGRCLRGKYVPSPRKPKLAKPCPHCAEPMPPRHRASCSAPECKRKALNSRMAKYQRDKTAEYRARGESYKGRWRTSEQRAALDTLPKNPEKNRARKQEGWQRRRAQKRTMPYETFRHVEIYERDNWICGLCNRPVDRTLHHSDPMSESLDHVIPLGPPHGGTHTRDNVQLAHRDCNSRKGDRLYWTPEVEDAYTDAAARSR